MFRDSSTVFQLCDHVDPTSMSIKSKDLSYGKSLQYLFSCRRCETQYNISSTSVTTRAPFWATQKKVGKETVDVPSAQGNVTLSILSKTQKNDFYRGISLTQVCHILEAKEPAFLRRLRAQGTGGSDGDRDPHRHQHPVIRPRGSLRDVDEDDGPVIVDERGDVVASEEYERLEREGREEGEAVDDDASREQGRVKAVDDGEGKRGQSIQEIGKKGPIGSKRKAVKIVGVDDEGDAEGRSDDKGKTKEKPAKPAKKKAKNRAAAGQVSFNDDDDG